MNINTCQSCKTQNPEGARNCYRCGNDVGVAVGRSGTGTSVSAQGVTLTTGQSVPNFEIVEVLGLVFSAGNAAWTLEGTSNKSNTAMGKASNNLAIQARQMGADAVIAIQMSIDGSGSAVNRSQTVSLIGTAVRLIAQ